MKLKKQASATGVGHPNRTRRSERAWRPVEGRLAQAGGRHTKAERAGAGGRYTKAERTGTGAGKQGADTRRRSELEQASSEQRGRRARTDKQA